MAQASYFCPQCSAQRLFTAQEMSHTPHILATVFLCGLWLPIWLLIAATYNPRFHCAQCGYTDSPKYLANPRLRQLEAQREAERQANYTPSAIDSRFNDPANKTIRNMIIGAVIALICGTVMLGVITDSMTQKRAVVTPAVTPTPYKSTPTISSDLSSTIPTATPKTFVAKTPKTATSKTATVISENANLRAAPSNDSTILLEIQQDANISVIKQKRRVVLCKFWRSGWLGSRQYNST